ncbi:hypothetical protein BJ165DRAFT_1523956 [Panaeolus papilionaceus]|nr:hypothetical protein BJ165DRAFT_1523956 [Panaeolus papilionaceus]
MVHPGSFHGIRKAFLYEQRGDYESGVQGGYAADAAAIIVRKYFKRFPASLSHDVDPTPEFLASVDDNEADDEYPEPDQETMSPDEYITAVQEHEVRRKLIVYRTAQIKRRLAYQYLKDHDIDPKESGAENPYYALLCKLTGVSVGRPAKLPAANYWRKTALSEINTELEERVKRVQVNRRSGLAGLRSTVTKDLFNQLPEAEREEWFQISKQDHSAKVAEWEERVKSGPSVDPQDRQRCIESLTRFIQPILDGICSATGWKATLIAGGPEPTRGGTLSVLSVHSGTTTGDVHMNFGRAESVRFAKYIGPIFSDFLKNCYSVEECKSRALPSDSPFEGLSGTVEESQGANVYSLDFPPPSTSQSKISTPLEAPPVPTVSTRTNPNASSVTHQPTSTTASSSNIPTTSGPVSPQGRIDPVPHPSINPKPSELSFLSRAAPVLAPRSGPPLSRSPSLSPSRNASPPRSPSPLFSPPGSPPGNDFPPPSPPRPDSPPRPLLIVSHPSSVPAPPFSAPAFNLAPAPPAVNPALDGLRKTNAPLLDPSQPPPHSLSNPLPHSLRSQNPGAPTKVNQQPSEHPTPNPGILAPNNLTRKRARVDSNASGHNAQASSSTNVTKRPRIARSGASKKTAAEKENPAASPNPEVGSVNEPKWFTEWLHVFQTEYKDLGPKKQDWLGLGFKELVDEWAAFERECGFVDRGRFSTTNRPEFVHLWIKNARKTTFRPDIKDVKGAQQNFKLWWDSVQPAWRRNSDGTVNSRRVQGDWSSLDLPGINGLFSAVAALFFIGLHSYSVFKTRAPWTYAVDDVAEAIRQLRPLTMQHPSLYLGSPAPQQLRPHPC